MSDLGAGADNLGLSAALATLQGLLTSGETLEAWAAQQRLYALTHRRALIAATSGRFISLEAAPLRRLRFRRHPLAGSQGNAHQRRDHRRRLDPGRAEQFRPEHRRRGESGVDASRACTRIRRRPCIGSASSTIKYGGRSAACANSRNCAPSPAACKSAVKPAYSGTDAAGAESEPARRLRQAREMLEAKLISDSEFESIKAKIVSGL